MSSRRKKITVPLSSFLAARIDADGQALFQGTVLPPHPPRSDKCRLDSHGSAVEIQHIALYGWLDPFSSPFDFPARLLRTSTFPVMHSLLPSATTKTDNLVVEKQQEEEEEEGRRRRGFA